MKKAALALIVGVLPALSFAGDVDLNTADAETLARELDGVGNARAEAIVDYREQHGSFLSADELLNVTGIGEYVLEANRAKIRVGEPGG
jgi:competence protein ComEA